MSNQKREELNTRPPLIVVMGHIDHGKTTLLDFIRKTKVTEGEAGGITQHVGAYEVAIKDRKITFLDTPGHEAFSKIRERGAKIADIAILVVAADDGIKEQTEEALRAITEANIPYIVAINKMDKESANPERVKKQLSEKSVQVEEWGGKVPSVQISAKTGQGIDDLLNMILLMADMEELKTDNGAPASGYVVESQIDKKRGVGAILLIQNGTLKQGMCVVAGDAVAVVRIFEDFAGKTIKEARASSPVKIIGFNKPPAPGDKFESFDCRKDAEAAINVKRNTISVKQPTSGVGSTDKTKASIPIIIKTDAVGSYEALEKQLVKIENEKIGFNILRKGAGDINEDDVKLASGSGQAIVVGFNVKCPADVKELAEKFGVEIKIFNIIYEAEDWLKKLLEKRRPVEEKEEIVGKTRVIKIFKTEKTKKIIGGEILEGKIATGLTVKIFRRDYLLGEGKIIELQKQQTKAKEVDEGQFGALVQTKTEIAPNDRLEIIEKTLV